MYSIMAILHNNFLTVSLYPFKISLKVPITEPAQKPDYTRN